MPRKKKAKQEGKIELKLLNALNSTDLFSQKNNRMDRLPLYISDNMKHHLRSYQLDAIRHLDAVRHMQGADELYNQLMFYMATGSGKTDIMAATILYLYHEWGYQCFLFTTHTTAVVAKTLDNFINSNSPKYLFNEPISIEGNRITIHAVDEYPVELEDNTIYIKFTGIQQLSNDIYTPHENGITEDSLARNKMIILADEAHHFNVGTRNKNSNQDSRNWERLLDHIRKLNSKNLQLEFTATIDLHNPEIYQKYQNKIIAEYDLGKFINDGYSKKVYRLQANNSDESKMLNAVLLSQYRKRIARNMDILDFKPVILFKSSTIKMSNDTEQIFREMIDGLTSESLQNFVQSQDKSTQSEALHLAYQYWLKQDFAETVSELKRDFRQFNVVNANDSSSKDILDDTSVAQKLNTLETNSIRAVFAVAKLSEGWDVLNLYDIVRIGEKNTTSKDTNSEAQLIGRGARYNPFIYQGKRSYRRRFDTRKTKIQLLERLYYHTINNPQYLENLRKSLDAINLPVSEDTKYQTHEAIVKQSFKQSPIYNYGNIYYNKVVDVPASSYDSIKKYGIDTESASIIDLEDATIERNYDTGADNHEFSSSHTIIAARFSNPADQVLIKAAVSYMKFFRFNKLKQYCPTLTSMNEFLTDKKWIGQAVVQARVANGTEQLTNDQRLIAVKRYLAYVQQSIVKNFMRSKGTNEFLPMAVKEVVNDYTKRVAVDFNNPTTAKIGSYSMNSKDWYVYDQAIVDVLEKQFIDQIGAIMPTLKQQYQDVYLIRIDERADSFKLHDFSSDVPHYAGYMPDFILYLKDADYIYQVYMEPKGDQLLERDNWKQELLERINPQNVVILGENQNVKLYGVKFFIRDDKRHTIQELRDKNLLKDSDDNFELS
ncbi:DEAD/DEAH box helicase family protein [Limosilactobacillus reuteri]|uniref:DEAD/DEAH box helicase family protein n=1 Tax=Limosilactobacillus reuteri TaxID=1598 RepID=UPI001E305BA2|nr:DEAD/DEAH box helicase family protein [Limosilactobacillus reuteri]MCC4328447.1 DEAD/DEAH box helicase family protein [Limosilactobacillus reuteri]MCC4336698.1 DEAD/DEAH box helicase family protein [Limosilactobacillus reuteri]MCC4338487.1 DEAD/DEAH box helicase family protein [Limosilactobacillus reuteri]